MGRHIKLKKLKKNCTFNFKLVAIPGNKAYSLLTVTIGNQVYYTIDIYPPPFVYPLRKLVTKKICMYYLDRGLFGEFLGKGELGFNTIQDISFTYDIKSIKIAI